MRQNANVCLGLSPIFADAVNNAVLSEYAYQYDDIGNRLSSLDLGTNRTYTANALNQYAQIPNLCDSASLREEFLPQFDDDMRPRRRRRVARRSVATEPRSGRKRPRNKNVSELVFFQQANGIAAHYEYAPFGAVTAASRSTPVTAYDFCEYNPFHFSSEYADVTLDLIYYNNRHFDWTTGRWLQRDKLTEAVSKCLYAFLSNQSIFMYDYLGNAPQYVYEGVALTYDSDGMRICASADWDYGDFDYYYGKESCDIDEFLDAAGVVDQTPIIDAIHAVTYIIRGDTGNTCVCLCACIPLGDIAKLGKYGAKGIKAVRQTRNGYKTAKEAAEAAAKNNWEKVGKDSIGETLYI